jgi:hypothetical protein
MIESIEGRNAEFGWLEIPVSAPAEIRARIVKAREHRMTHPHGVKPNHIAGVVSEDDIRRMRLQVAMADL